jgi:hypothetical protein
MSSNADFFSFTVSAEVGGLLRFSAGALNLTPAEAFGRAVSEYDTIKPANYAHGAGDEAEKHYKLNRTLQGRMSTLAASSKHTESDIATAVIRQFAMNVPA